MKIFTNKSVFSFWVLLFILELSGCGFQLNRNRLQLPNGATSIYFYQIVNRSYIPRLDLDLKDKLIGKFTQNSIDVRLTDEADMILSFTLESLTTTKSEYSLDDSEQTYEYAFKVQGRLSVFDNRTQSYYLNNVSVGSSYSITTEDTDLSSIDEEDGRSQVLDKLGNVIAKKLTDSF